MCEQHLDFLSPATGLHVLRSCGVRTGHVAGVFVQIPRDLAGKSVHYRLCEQARAIDPNNVLALTVSGIKPFMQTALGVSGDPKGD